MKKNLLSPVRCRPMLANVTSVFKKTAFLLFLSLSIFKTTIAQNWEKLGSEQQIATAASSFTTIAVVGTMPYVAFTEAGIAKVKRMTSPGVWEQVGGNLSAGTVTYTRIYADKTGKLYVTYVDGTNGNRLAMFTYNAGANEWQPLVTGDPYVSTGSVTHSISQYSSTPRNAVVFDENNIPYVIFPENSTTGNAFVRRFVNGAWETLGGGPVSSDRAVSVSIALDNLNVPYVVYSAISTATSTTGILTAYRFNVTTNSWDNITPTSPVTPGTATTGNTTSVRHPSIAMDSSFNPLVSFFNTNNSNRSTIIRLDKSALVWTYIGTTSTRDAPNNTLLRDNGGNVYNSFQDAIVNGGRPELVRVFKLRVGSGGFTELLSTDSPYGRGIDSTGEATTATRTTALQHLSMAVGSDTSRPYIVYTKTNANGVLTPIVQIYNSGLTVTFPVKMGELKANKANGQVQLNWSVFEETNVNNYVVERSTDGSSFTTVGSVKASKKSSYSFTDANPASGKNVYRVKAVDVDNSTTYSKGVLVDFSKITASLKVSPNPIVNGFFTVQFADMKAGKVQVKLYSNNGQLVMDQPVNYNGSNDNQLINLSSNVTRGNYQLVITDGTNVQKASVIVQ